MSILMTQLRAIFCGLVLRDDGQDLVEYALVVSCIALGCIVALKTVSDDVLLVYNGIKSAIDAAV